MHSRVPFDLPYLWLFAAEARSDVGVSTTGDDLLPVDLSGYVFRYALIPVMDDVESYVFYFDDSLR